MTDRVSSIVRSRIMASIPGKGTKPELAVRSIAHALGYRFRLHRADLPGKPDMVFPSRKKAIFVNGCFWHGHECKHDKMPQSNKAFWEAKVQTNRARDARVCIELTGIGWSSLTIWECETKTPNLVAEKLLRFLGPVKTT
jgi:DNA mismatch endonuclease (patch repair protein)